MFNFIYWVSDSVMLLLHWLFNMRYVFSTFTLDIQIEQTRIYCEMVHKAVSQRQEQAVIFSAEELSDN